MHRKFGEYWPKPHFVNIQLGAGKGDCANAVVTNSSSSSYVPIVAFAPFAIDVSVGGDGKYITGHFVTGYKISTTVSGTGPNYGADGVPKLAI